MRLDPEILRGVRAFQMTGAETTHGSRTGERRSPHRGRGLEFADYRPYVPGDDLRTVDWNVYGRLGQLMVRLFHEDRNMGVSVCVDYSGSMASGEEEKLRHAANVAACLGMVTLTNRDTLRITCAGPKGTSPMTQGHDSRAMAKVMQLLEKASTGGTNTLETGIGTLMHMGKTDRSFLVSDLLVEQDARARVLKMLAASGRKSVLVHVLGAAELNPEFVDGQRCQDAETGVQVRIRWDAAGRKAYKDDLNKWVRGIEVSCGRLGVHYVQAWTTTPVLDLFSRVLRTQRLVRHARDGA